MAAVDKIDSVELAFQYALTRIGVSTVEEAIVLWQMVAKDNPEAAANAWLQDATSMILRKRAVSQRLALAYYRLVRALRTGSTINDPFKKREPKHVSIGDLRREFQDLVDSVAPGAPPLGSFGDDSVNVDTIPHLADIMKQSDQNAVSESGQLLPNLGTNNLRKKLDAIDLEQTGSAVDQQRKDAHRAAGARSAAVAERISMNAARGLVYDISQYDGKVLGWVRFSTTGTPCGWCAMLISRGPVYKSARSATNPEGADQNKYHDNCHCIAVPVFSEEQFKNSALFDLNRQYRVEWARVTNGLGGDAALSAWRHYIRQTTPTKKAQAAA